MSTDYQIQRSLSGSTSTVVTETGLVKSGQGVLRGIVTTATSSGTLVVSDATEASVVATGTLTQSVGAGTPASHGQTELTSTGAMVAGTHAVTVFTNAGTNHLDAVKASAVLTSDQTIPTAGDTVTIGTEVFTFIANNAAPSKYNVRLGTTATQAMLNLFEALKNSPDVDVVHTSTFVITVTAKVAGVAGNSIAKAEASTHLDWDGAGASLTGGLAAETVTIGSIVYRFKDVLEQAYDVKIGSTIELSLDNLYAAINGSGTTGVNYCTGTIAHTQVIGVAHDATTITLRGRVPGTSLNTVATTETCAAASFPDTTLGGGTGASDAGVTTGAATVTIGSVTYTVVDELSETYGASPVAYQVKKGAAEANMLDNLKLAINGGSGEGTLYSTGTDAHPYVIATTNSNTVQKIVARTVGNAAYTAIINALATTETMANTAWADTTFGGGTGNSNPAITSDEAQITIGTRTYTAVLELSETSGADAVVDQILWVTSEAVFLDNFKKAINQTGIAGTDYSTGTTQNTQVIATTNANDSQVINARLLGSAQNAIATTATLDNYAWGATTLASGTGAVGKVLLSTYTPAAGSAIDLENLEFENGLFVTVGGTSISSTFIYK